MKLSSLRFFLFGSFEKTATPNDIDLLILYDSGYVNISQILSLRRRILAHLEGLINIPVDISLLNFIEEEELNFIVTEKASELFIN